MVRLIGADPELELVGVVLLSQHAEVPYALALLEGGSAGRPTCSRIGSPTSAS